MPSYHMTPNWATRLLWRLSSPNSGSDTPSGCLPQPTQADSLSQVSPPWVCSLHPTWVLTPCVPPKLLPCTGSCPLHPAWVNTPCQAIPSSLPIVGILFTQLSFQKPALGHHSSPPHSNLSCSAHLKGLGPNRWGRGRAAQRPSFLIWAEKLTVVSGTAVGLSVAPGRLQALQGRTHLVHLSPAY